MKSLILCLLLASPASAGLLDINGLADLAAEKAKETRAATLIDITGTFSGAIYLPIWTFHTTGTADAPGVNLISLGAGGALREGGNKQALLTLTFNGPGLSGRLWNSDWARAHLTRTKLPELWIGPYLKAPTPGQKWVIGREVGGIVSIGLGGK
mgnify:CR=1 FL=1